MSNGTVHHPPERVELDGLTLRFARLDDAEQIAEAVRSSLEHLVPWMPWATPEAGTVEEQRVRRIEGQAGMEAGSDYMYLLMDDEERSLLGVVGLHRRVGPGAIEIGYWLRPEAVGGGRMTTAVTALTDAALALPDVDRVEIHCDEANLRSQAVPPRAGYRLDRIEDDEIQTPNEVGRSMVWVNP